MRKLTNISNMIIRIVPLILIAFLILPALCLGQGEEVASFIRYRQYEVSTGYYEQYEMKPNHDTPLIGRFREQGRRPFTYSSTAAQVRNRSRLADSHWGIKFYENRRCEECHAEQARDIHTVRAKLTCRQCHGQEPIASINHYFSPMNPIRRHAYVCSKCHQGASASFARYLVHEPPAGASATRTGFPALYYAYWFMLLLWAGTLAFFIPHSVLMGIRELFRKRKDG